MSVREGPWLLAVALLPRLGLEGCGNLSASRGELVPFACTAKMSFVLFQGFGRAHRITFFLHVLLTTDSADTFYKH